jgi:hypothetical protein
VCATGIRFARGRFNTLLFLPFLSTLRIFTHDQPAVSTGGTDQRLKAQISSKRANPADRSC